MSVGANVWRQFVSGIATVPRGRSTPAPSATVHGTSDPLFSLVHQLFFPAAAVRRKSILLASPDERTSCSVLCGKIASTLARASSQTVAIVRTSPISHGNAAHPEGSPPQLGRGLWQAYASPVEEGVWQISSELVCNERSSKAESIRYGVDELSNAFEYLLFSTTVTSSELPIFCNMCDAAVLVLTANVTRREAALRAKEQLLRYRVNLIGTVLDQRTLPIPESVYRRL